VSRTEVICATPTGLLIPGIVDDAAFVPFSLGIQIGLKSECHKMTLLNHSNYEIKSSPMIQH